MRKLAALCLLGLVAAQAGAQPVGLPGVGEGVAAPAEVSVSARLPVAETTAGGRVVAEFSFTCPPEHYVWHDSVTIKLADAGGAGDGIRPGALTLPEPKEKYDEFAGGNVAYLDGAFAGALALEVSDQVPAGVYGLAFDVRYTECGGALCRFGRATPSLRLTVLPAAPAAAPSAEPQAPSAEEFMPLPAAPVQAATAAGEFAGRGTLLAVLLAFVAGLGLAFTPCVYPLIPITVSLIGATSGGRRLDGLGRSLVYVLGISVTYAVVGLVASATGGLFGAWLQHPAVHLALAALFVAMAAAMFGLFTVDVTSQRLQRLQARLRGRAGIAGIFAIGLLSGAAATACIAPVIVGALGYVAQRGSVLVGLLMFFAMAWGMGAPLIVLGTFAGLVRSLPKSGEWMVVVKHVFGWGLLAAAVYFVGKSSVLPEFWFRLLTAAFLLGAAVFVGALDVITPADRWRPRARKTVGIMLFVGAVVAFLWAYVPLAGGAWSLPGGTQAEGIQWADSEAEALATGAAERRPVLLDFWAQWCAPCQKMLKTTFADPAVVAGSRRFVCAKIDVDRLAGAERERLLTEYGVRGVPTIILVGSDGQRHAATGYQDARAMLRLLQSVR